MFFDPSYYPGLESYQTSADTSWWNNDPSIISGQNDTSIVVQPNSAGLYSYVFNVEDDFGCAYDTTVLFSVLDVPEVNITDDILTFTCIEDVFDLQVVSNLPNMEWAWTYGSVTQILGTSNTLSVGTNIAPIEQNGGYYYVTGTDPTSGCFSMDSVMILIDTIAAPPNPTSNVQTPAIFDCTASSVAMTNTTPDADISWVLNSDLSLIHI